MQQCRIEEVEVAYGWVGQDDGVGTVQCTIDTWYIYLASCYSMIPFAGWNNSACCFKPLTAQIVEFEFL